VVTPDFSGDDTDLESAGSVTAHDRQAIAEWESVPSGCPAGTLAVITGVRSEFGAADPQGGATFVTGVTNVLNNEPFFIVVP
jgi:hypothetical protein